jgi:hypothetical protein
MCHAHLEGRLQETELILRWEREAHQVVDELANGVRLCVGMSCDKFVRADGGASGHEAVYAVLYTELGRYFCCGEYVGGICGALVSAQLETDVSSEVPHCAECRNDGLRAALQESVVCERHRRNPRVEVCNLLELVLRG